MATQSRSFEEAIRELNNLQTPADVLAEIGGTPESRARLNVPKMAFYLKRCGIELEDLDKLPVILISGTAGKTSTAAFCESILLKYGLKTGMFSAPHMMYVNERIRLNGNPIAKDEFSKYFFEVFHKLDETATRPGGYNNLPTYYMFLTVMALYIFSKKKKDIDVAIMEVCMRGEYDCTNVIRKPVVCGIASLGVEQTVNKTAWNNAGTFKCSVPAVTVQQGSFGMDLLLCRAKEKGATVYVTPDMNGDLRLGIPGCVQKQNATLALHLCKVFLDLHVYALPKRRWLCDQSNLENGSEIPEMQVFSLTEEMRQGLSNCVWPGYMQTVKHPKVTYYLDGASAPKGIEECVEWFKTEAQKSANETGGRTCKVLLFSVHRSQKAKSMLSVLKDVGFDAAIFCPEMVFPEVEDNPPDIQYYNVTVDGVRKTAQDNKSIWDSITMTHESKYFESIFEALSWATQTKDPDIRQNAEQINSDAVSQCLEKISSEPVPECLKSSDHIQILITGSMSLVGNAMFLIKPELW